MEWTTPDKAGEIGCIYKQHRIASPVVMYGKSIDDVKL